MPSPPSGVPRLVQGVIDRLIEREGGYVNDPDDPGKETNMGITFAVFREWRGIASVDALKNLSHQEASLIYFQVFWFPNMEIYHANWWLKEFMFDWYVHSGTRNSNRHIQRLVGAKPDGYFGPNTAKLVKEYWLNNPKTAKMDLVLARIYFWFRIIKRVPVRAKYGPGWLNRIRSLV